MKDENKVCFNKTLTYLVLLVAAVVGAFYVMNYANTQKVSKNTEAGAPVVGSTCPSYLTDGQCHQQLMENGVTYKKTGFYCKDDGTGTGRKEWRIAPSGTCVNEICYFGGKNARDAASGYTLDANSCILKAGVKQGYRCPGNGYLNAIRDVAGTCAATAIVVPRTACTMTLNGVTKPVADWPGYTMSGSCIQLNSKNTGYKCDAGTGWKNLWNTTDCPPQAVNARSACTINGKPVDQVTGYSMSGSCIQLNSKNTGYKCDAGTGWKNLWNTTDCPPQAAAAARTACLLDGKPQAQWPAGYTMDAGTGCFLLNGKKTGLKCNLTTFKNSTDTATCAPEKAACDSSGVTKCGTFSYGTCVGDGYGGSFKCECAAGFNYPKMNHYLTANCT
jgi:hypothetical protein